MTIARVSGGTIVETRALALDAVPAHKRDAWREVPAKPSVDLRGTTVTGPTWNGSEVVWGSATRPLDAVKAEALARLDAARLARGTYHAAGAGADPAKLSLYTSKLSWALNHLLGNTIDDAKLEPEATARGITLTQLATLIKAKSDAATAGVAAVEGAYATASTLVTAAATVADALAAEDAGIAAIEAS